MHKNHQGKLTDVFGEYFVYTHHIHSHNTRISSHLHVPKMFSCLSQTGIRYQGVIIWNKILMTNINPDNSEACFKTMLKKAIQHKSICTDWTYCIDTSLMISHNFYALPAPVIIIKWSNCVPDMGPTNTQGFLAPFCHLFDFVLFLVFIILLLSCLCI